MPGLHSSSDWLSRCSPAGRCRADEHDAKQALAAAASDSGHVEPTSKVRNQSCIESVLCLLGILRAVLVTAFCSPCR